MIWKIKQKQYNINRRSATSAYYKCITQSAFIAFFIGHFLANKLHWQQCLGPEVVQQHWSRHSSLSTLSWSCGNLTRPLGQCTVRAMLAGNSHLNLSKLLPNTIFGGLAGPRPGQYAIICCSCRCGWENWNQIAAILAVAKRKFCGYL